ncbi:MAG: phage holin family protein [Patescibacteria group bacterium]|nr:phage holin family protein [Patescibacteria group bacterium]
MNIIIRWILLTLAVMVVAFLLPGVQLSGLLAAFVVAVVLGLINVVLRPIALILTLPVNILTLGLLTLVIDALLVMLAAHIVPGFELASFWWALLFALVLSLVNWMLKDYR